MHIDEPSQQPDLSAFDDDALQHQMQSTAAASLPKEKITAEKHPGHRPASEKKTVQPDPAVAPQRKKKDIRKERKRQKLLSQGLDPDSEELKRKSSTTPASLEEYLAMPMPDSPKHSLVTRLVMPGDRDPYFAESLTETFQLYKKYELTIHKKDSDRPTEKQVCSNWNWNSNSNSNLVFFALLVYGIFVPPHNRLLFT